MIKTRSWLAPTLLIIGTAIPITPVAIHNSRAEGSFVMLTTHGGFNFYMGNHERATGYPLKVLNFRMTAKEMLEDAHHYAEQSSGQSMSRAESSSWWSDQANAFWKTNPLNATVLTAKKVALFWNHRDMDDLRILEQLRVSDSFFNYFRGTPFALFGILGLIGVVFARGAIIPRTALLVGMASIALFFITARYRLTFVPLMAIIGSVGTMQLMRNWRAGNRAKTLFLIPIILLVLFPFSVRDQRPVDYYNTAIQLTAEQKLDEALEIVNLGLEIDPNFGSLHFAKGNVLFTQENYADAVEAFKIARTLSPENTTILFNLALSYARMGDYCGARDVLKGQSLDAKSSALFKELNAACDQ